MAYLIFYFTKLITRVKSVIFTKNKRYFFIILDIIATTNVIMMRLSSRYNCPVPLNTYIYINKFSTVSLLPHGEQLRWGGGGVIARIYYYITL